MKKSELRQIIRERKRQYSSEQLEVLSLAVIGRLMAHPKVVDAHCILLYYSLPDEVNTHQLAETLREQGKQVLLPKVTGDGTMEIRRYEGRQSMTEGDFHIMEPSGAIFTDYAAIDLAIVPGMSFDAAGNRLGRGKGYYDRFFALAPALYKIGICFDFQKTDHVPCETTDIAMDEVL